MGLRRIFYLKVNGEKSQKHESEISDFTDYKNAFCDTLKQKFFYHKVR